MDILFVSLMVKNVCKVLVMWEDKFVFVAVKQGAIHKNKEQLFRGFLVIRYERRRRENADFEAQIK